MHVTTKKNGLHEVTLSAAGPVMSVSLFSLLLLHSSAVKHLGLANLFSILGGAAVGCRNHWVVQLHDPNL